MWCIRVPTRSLFSIYIKECGQNIYEFMAACHKYYTCPRRNASKAIKVVGTDHISANAWLPMEPHMYTPCLHFWKPKEVIFIIIFPPTNRHIHPATRLHVWDPWTTTSQQRILTIDNSNKTTGHLTATKRGILPDDCINVLHSSSPRHREYTRAVHRF